MNHFRIWPVVLLALVPPSVFGSATYTYTSSNFAFFASPYGATFRISGSFMLAAPLAANLPQSDISAQVLGYSFSDGVQTRTQANSQICAPNPYGFRVSTDASGNIATWAITLCSPVTSVGDHVSEIVTIHGFSTAVDEDVGIADSICIAVESGLCSQNNVITSAYVYSGNSPSFWYSQAPADCQAMAGVWGNVSIGLGNPTDVRTWVFVRGDVITLSVQGAPGNVTIISIVDSPEALHIYAGPFFFLQDGSSGPVTFQPPAGLIPLGYYANVSSGPGLLSLTCAGTGAPVTGPQPADAVGIPAIGRWALPALALIVGVLGLAALRARSRRAR
jgi:hypothetical protein